MRKVPPFAVVFFVVLWVQGISPVCAQTVYYPLEEWVKKLDAVNDRSDTAFIGVSAALAGDSASTFTVLQDLQKAGAHAGHYFKARFNILKASKLWIFNRRAALAPISELCKDALLEAYQANDEILAANISWQYGDLMYNLGQIEPAAMYCLNGAELFNRKGIAMDEFSNWLLGEILYHTRDYEKSIYYNELAIKKAPGLSKESKRNVMSRWNTMALCWQRIGTYDSAFVCYDKAMALADELNSEVWKGIISGNKGQIHYQQHEYDLAKPLLLFDYLTSVKYGEWANAANSLQWAARISLREGKKDSALLQAKEAMLLLKRNVQADYLQNLYYATADVYRVAGPSDSFYLYFQLYSTIHDSIERSVANSRMEISRIKMDNQENLFKIRDLQKEKETKLLTRNYIIAAIVLVAIIALLLMNRQRLKLQYRQQLALEHKKAAEAETAAAVSQLQLFTQTLIEKTSVIERLQQQLQSKELTLGQQQLADELSHQTILTDEDWAKFRSLFEKIYPGFFISLKQRAIDITAAELRMGALTRLQLTTKQMASILGISADSVNKTRQRLRARLKLTADDSLEQCILEI